jgi:hypothetical protein
MAAYGLRGRLCGPILAVADTRLQVRAAPRLPSSPAAAGFSTSWQAPSHHSRRPASERTDKWWVWLQRNVERHASWIVHAIGIVHAIVKTSVLGANGDCDIASGVSEHAGVTIRSAGNDSLDITYEINDS